MNDLLSGIAQFNSPILRFPALSGSNGFSLGGFSQAGAQSFGPFGYSASLAQSLRSPYGIAGRSGALNISPLGLNLAAAFAAAPRFGLPSTGAITRHIGHNGQSEAISRSNPLSQESLAGIIGRDFIALGASDKTPFGSKSRAIALTPLGIVISGASTGIFGNDQYRYLV